MYNYVLKNSSHHPKKWIIRFDPYGIVPLTKETLACSSLDLRGNSIGTDDDDDDTHFKSFQNTDASYKVLLNLGALRL